MDFQNFDVEPMDDNFPEFPPHSDPGEVKQIGASLNDVAGFASRAQGMSTYGDDTHNYGRGHEGRKHRINTSCLSCSGAVPLTAVGESNEATTSGCTCSLRDVKRIKQDDLELKQDPFESSWEANSHSPDAKSNLFSITEYSALGPEVAEESTESNRAFTSFGDFLSFPHERPSLQQEVGHAADSKSLPYQPLNHSAWPFEHNDDQKALIVKGNVPTKQQWEAMRPLIRRLYVDERRTLAGVSEELRKRYGFSPSRRQLIRRLAEWNLHKNFKKPERRVILERCGENLPSSPTRNVDTILLRGRKLDSVKLKRWSRQLQEDDSRLASTELLFFSEMVHDAKEVLQSPIPLFKQLLVDQSSFACPFAKKDPLKYRSCLDFTLKRIRDVKQHLNRNHPLPIYCARCMCIFETEYKRDEHVQTSRCGIQTGITYEGVTMAQKLQLAQKVSSKLTFEDQWFTIFDILFPGQIARPKSAYKSLTVALDGFQDLTYTEGPDIILQAMLARGIRFAEDSIAKSDQSAVVLSAIEDGLQQFMQRWTASMQLTLPNASNPREAATEETSNLPPDQKVVTPDQLYWSSDKLPEILPEATAAVPDISHSAQYENYGIGVNEFNQASHLELMQEHPSWLDNNMNTQNFGGTGQPGELNAWYTDQQSVEPFFNGSMVDGSEMWQGFNQSDFFQINSGGAAGSSDQVLENSDIYHQIIDEKQHMRE